MSVGKSINRVDAVDKVTGRANYTDDLMYRRAGGKGAAVNNSKRKSFIN